ncbi:MAG TPA: peptidoglycan editing factor PgeF [Syntrophales bacterium]|nr:peptidoglycan editing factor PgeF [Syntrophales bacterium]HPO34711.1 peptidoglycan editing factor PgeF [Syntrophales bacterium]
MYELTRQKGLPCLKARCLSEIPVIKHAFLTRQGGISRGNYGTLNVSLEVGDEPALVKENLFVIARAFGFDVGQFFFLHQVHGRKVIRVEGRASTIPDADAAITDQKGLALAIKTADCVPILLCDPERPAIGAVHAGWRGTAGQIAMETVEAMERAFGTKRASLLAALGPGIGACCYEVDERVVSALKRWEGPGIYGKENKFFVDLALINARQLLAADLTEDHIAMMDLCTSCQGHLFFSHRRDRGKTGRQLSFIMIKGMEGQK